MVTMDFVCGFIAGSFLLTAAALIIYAYSVNSKETRMRRKHQGCCNCKFHTPAGHCKCYVIWDPFTNSSVSSPDTLIYATNKCHYEPKE